MAHFVLDYSANLRDELDVGALFRAVHAAAVETGVFPLGGVRFRAICCEDYLIADGDPANAYVNLSIKVGHGRPLEVRRAAADRIFAALTKFLQPVFDARPLGISMEMVELDPELNYKHNNIHEYLRKKESKPDRQ